MIDERIQYIMKLMHEFQIKNNIIKLCKDNTKYLYDFIVDNKKFLNISVSVKAFICIVNDKLKTRIINHIAIINNKTNEIYEPSYEIYSLKNVVYVDKIIDFMKIVKKNNIDIENKEFKKHMSDYIYFCKYANYINNGNISIVNKKIYNDQADYIEKKCRENGSLFIK